MILCLYRLWMGMFYLVPDPGVSSDSATEEELNDVKDEDVDTIPNPPPSLVSGEEASLPADDAVVFGRNQNPRPRGRPKGSKDKKQRKRRKGKGKNVESVDASANLCPYHIRLPI